MVDVQDMPPLSPSQIKLWRGCEARWGFVYLSGGEREPDSQHTALGKLVHKELEDWVNEGKLPSHRVALAGLPFAPAPRTALTERAMSFLTASSPWRGYIDLSYALVPGSKVTSPEIFRAHTLVIQDWKTTTKLENAKSPEDLLDDEQSNLYAYEGYTVQEAENVRGKWVYLTTTGAPKTLPVEFAFERSRVIDTVGVIDEDAAKVQRLYQLSPKPTELKKSTGYCYAFKKQCPAFDKCKPNTSTQISFANLNKGTAAVTDFKQRLGQVGNGAPPLPGKPSVPSLPGKPSVPALPGAAAKAAPGLPSKPAAPTLPSKPAVPGLPKKPDINERWRTATEALRAEGDPAPGQVDNSFVNPDTAPAQAAATPEEAAAQQGITKPEPPAPDDLDGMTRDQLKAIGQLLGCIDPKSKAREASLRDTIRAWRKSNPEVESAMERGDAVVIEKTYEERAPESPVLRPAAPVDQDMQTSAVCTGFTLYVNCGDANDSSFAYLVDKLNRRIHATENVVDFGLIEFGKGPAALRATYADLEAEYNAVGMDLHGDLVVDSRTQAGMALMDVLVLRARKIVRGWT